MRTPTLFDQGTVICDDGAVFVAVQSKDGTFSWAELPPIPGTFAANAPAGRFPSQSLEGTNDDKDTGAARPPNAGAAGRSNQNPSARGRNGKR